MKTGTWVLQTQELSSARCGRRALGNNVFVSRGPARQSPASCLFETDPRPASASTTWELVRRQKSRLPPGPAAWIVKTLPVVVRCAQVQGHRSRRLLPTVAKCIHGGRRGCGERKPAGAPAGRIVPRRGPDQAGPDQARRDRPSPAALGALRILRGVRA